MHVHVKITLTTDYNLLSATPPLRVSGKSLFLFVYMQETAKRETESKVDHASSESSFKDI